MATSIGKLSKSFLLKLLVGIIILPFVFWGMGDVFRGGNQNVIASIDSEKISTQEFVEYLRNKETKTYSNLTPPNTTTESMTNSKLAVLEAGFTAIKEIKRPAEKRLALLDLSKQLQLPQGELSKLIQELSFEKSQLNNQYETFDSVMSADIDQELIVDKLIMSGTISMVAAESGTGKSSLIYQIQNKL